MAEDSEAATDGAGELGRDLAGTLLASGGAEAPGLGMRFAVGPGLPPVRTGGPAGGA